MRKGTPLASRVAQGVSGPSSSCVWNPRVFADDARGWQCPFVFEFPRETGLILRCAGKAGNPFQTTQGNRQTKVSLIAGRFFTR